MSARTTQAIGEKIQRLRKARLWSTEELAAEAKCDAKTIQNAEASKHLYHRTLRRIADALQIEPNDIMNPTQREYDVLELTLITKLSIHVTNRNEVKKFIKSITDAAKPFYALHPFRIEPGSTVMSFQINRFDAVKIVNAFLDGKLDHLQVVSIAIKDEKMAPPEKQSSPSPSKTKLTT